jgi:acyl-CoA hydrolase
VTELGAADLRGCDADERARRLRAIASAHSAV